LAVAFAALHRILIRRGPNGENNALGSLAFRRLLIAALASIFLLDLAGLLLTSVFEENERAQYREYIEGIAIAYAGVLGHREAVNPPSEGPIGGGLHADNKTLEHWLEDQKGIKSIYLLKRHAQTGFIYYSAASDKRVSESSVMSALDRRIDSSDTRDELERAFLGQPGSTKEPMRNELGVSLSAFAPVWLDGSTVGAVVRVDVDGNVVAGQLAAERHKAMGLLLIPYVMILAAYWLLIRSRLEKINLSAKQKELQTEQERYRILSDSSVEGMLIHREGTILEMNAAICRLLGYQPEDLLGESILKLIGEEGVPVVEENLRRKRSICCRLRGIHKEGHSIELELHVNNCIYNGLPARAVAVRDITEQKRQEEKIYRLAYYDELTGLPNKKRFLRSLSHRLNPHGNARNLMVVFMDLDNFKPVNDSFGHSIGDQAMKECAARLLEALPPGGKLSRWGGDEFIAMVQDVHDREEAKAIGRRFIDALEKPVFCQGVPVKIGTSVGISLYPEDGTDHETLIRKADTAMYIGKKLRTNSVHFFDHSLQEKAENRVRMEQELRMALKEGQFVLHYQPQVWMETGEIRGVEALIRWNHPLRGHISPAEFIPLAEETGLILELGDWVLMQACRDMKQLQEAGLPPLSISINLSALQFGKEDLTGRIRDVLEETGLPPGQLELEITETMMMDPLRALGILRQLKSLGVRISIDDFGTGYSSLHYINRFPIDKLKIDRSFITDLGSGEAPITTAIISLAQNMRMEIIAEGVETNVQAECLLRLGCPLAQGFLYYKPMTKEKLLSVITCKLVG
jgi:diguanylate cyclase (GGDEF)-like protein/PAS domain S-box-containing protein